MRFPTSARVAALTSFALSAALSPAYSAVAALPPGVVATVNGIPIRTADISNRLWRESGSVTLDFAIKSEIIRAESSKRGIVVSPEEVQTRVAEYKITFITAPGHTPRDWDDFIKRFGMQNIERQQMDALLVTRIGEDEAKHTALTPDEIARVTADVVRAGHKVHARIVFVGTGLEFGGRTDQEARARAEESNTKITAGASWEDVVRTYSDDVSTRTHAGDLGFVTRDQVERPLEDALFAAKSGPDVRQIVRLAQGYAVVDILGRQDAPTQEADKQKALDDTLKRKQALAREFTTWFPEVEKSYPVERLLPYRR